MPQPGVTLQDTDVEWEKWGARDPYFGVLTHDRFRSSKIAADDYQVFFESGRCHVDSVLATCRRHFGKDFKPRRVLDFGCGVGRLLLPFAKQCEAVVGVDISESMLAEAGRNCARFGVTNTTLVRGDDTLSAVEGRFDLVHSTIVFQHIESERGLDIIARLVQLVAPGGGLSLQVTYGRNYGECRYGQPLLRSPALAQSPSLYQRALSLVSGIARSRKLTGQTLRTVPDAGSDPVMMMYQYDLSRIAFILQTAGAKGYFAEFTDHGGELGITLYARIDAQTTGGRPDASGLAPNVH